MDFCVEYCRRQPPTSTPLDSVFEAKLPNTPASIHSELLDVLSAQATQAWLSVMAVVTKDREIIERLIKNKDSVRREALDRNPHLEASHIDALARNGVFGFLASNPAVSSSKLNSWAKDEDPAIRRRVAENPNTTMTTLVKLSKDPELEVQQAAKHEIQKREVGGTRSQSIGEIVFGDDQQTRIRQALINNDLDAFTLSLNGVGSPDVLDGLLPFVCLMPVSIERRLVYANLLLEKGVAAIGDFIGPLIDSFIVALGTKGAEGEVTAARDYLLRIIDQGVSLGAIPAESQCELYEYRRKGRQEATKVLFSLIDQAIPIREKSLSRNNKTGRTIVEKAIHHGDVELVSRVVNADRKALDEAAAGALSAAIDRKNQEMLDLLLSDGAERYASADAVKNAIIEICNPDYGKPKGVENLPKLASALRKIEDIELTTCFLHDCLGTAVWNGYFELVQELIRCGAPLNRWEGISDWGNLVDCYFQIYPKGDKVFMALVDAGLDLNHPIADRYREEIQKILKRAKR